MMQGRRYSEGLHQAAGSEGACARFSRKTRHGLDHVPELFRMYETCRMTGTR